MYRGLTTFKCTNCGHIFKSHDIEYRATAFSVPQRCPQCGSIRTIPGFGGENIYKRIWEEIEQAQKEREEKRSKDEAKRKAIETEQRKKQAKKRRHMSRGQKEKQDKQRQKKAAKRNRRQQLVELPKDEIIVLGTTWFPPGTPLKIDEE
jgi:DNA-directed RNA polymerase subunit RPC12/RpoP